MVKKLLLLVLVFNFNAVIFSQNDSIRLSQKDLIVGELKNLDKSILTFDTKYADSDFKIKWSDILEVYSSRSFIISLSNGERVTSTINTDQENKSNVILEFEGVKKSIPIMDVIFLEPIASRFLNRLEADFDVGLTLTKTNNLKQLSSNFNLKYLAYKWDLRSSFNLVYSEQDDIDNVKRWSGNITGQRSFNNNWYLQLATDLLSNTEQKIKLRSTTGLGGGYYIKRNNNLTLGVGGGVAYNNEKFSNNVETNNSMEAYIGAQFNKYDIGDLSLLTSIKFSPSITDKGRNRTDFKFTMKYDLPLDFYVKMEVNYNYDNKPVEGATKDDYVFQTTFGWEFN